MRAKSLEVTMWFHIADIKPQQIPWSQIKTPSTHIYKTFPIVGAEYEKQYKKVEKKKSLPAKENRG